MKTLLSWVNLIFRSSDVITFDIPLIWRRRCDKFEESYESTVEAVAQKCSVKKVFLEVLQNSQENICVGVSF